MARSRAYTVRFSGVAVTVVQDLFLLIAGASMGFEIHSFTLGQVTSIAGANLGISLKRFASTVTNGSGGSTPTPKKVNRGDAAATVTAHANDTSQASTSGANDVLFSDVFNTVNGYQWIFPIDDRPTFGLSEAAVLTLDNAPGSSMTMSGSITFAELL